MRLHIHSYRYAEEILLHPRYIEAWKEIKQVLDGAPLFLYPEKSKKKPKLDVVQQVMNTYFDRRFAVDTGWDYHPLATKIADSGLKADFRKDFDGLRIQAEVQFGNMSRWYSDIFKFQTAYAQSLIDVGLSVVPTAALARRIDSNVVNYERALRELPSAQLSITLPILLIGLEPDAATSSVNVKECKFSTIKALTGKGRVENRWRIVNGYLSRAPMRTISSRSPTGPMPASPVEAEEEITD